jgi:2-oxo-4-hydroxy-4-carboxy--5-ureidoimidazoline (OHCU) decarboxylase
MHYNRKQRRSLARGMGLLNRSSNSVWRERVRRSIQAGIQIDQQFKNQVESRLRNAATEKEAAMIKADPDAAGRIAKNRKIAEEREIDLEVRRNRQHSFSII